LDKYQEAAEYLRQQHTNDSGYLKEIAGMLEELRVKARHAAHVSTSAQRAAMARERERGAVVSQMQRHSRSQPERQMQ
jgi:hypothetical protein